MWLIVIAAMIVAAPFLLALHFSRSATRLKMADRVWGNLEQHASALMNDKTLNPIIGDLAEAMLMRAGDGSLTRAFLLSLLLPQSRKPGPIGEAVDGLHDGQLNQFMRFVIYAILYDSLRTTFSGAVLRRVVLYWLLPTAKDVEAPVSRTQVTPIATAAGRAYHFSEACSA